MSKKSRREMHRSLGLPDLDVLRDQLAYSKVVKEEYERAKARHEEAKAEAATQGLERRGPGIATASRKES